MKAPSNALPTWEGPGLKFQPNHLLGNPGPNLNQDQKKDKIQWANPTNGLWKKWTGLEASTPTGGKKLQPVGGSSWGHTLWRKATMILKPGTIPSGRQQPSGYRPPSRRPSGWWDALPRLSGLCPKDFMPITDASSPKDFQVMRQEKTLALAQALQAYHWWVRGQDRAFSATCCENSKDVWPSWWPSVGTT